MELCSGEMYILQTIYQDDMHIKEEASKKKNGKFMIHIENVAKFGVDIEFRYPKGYPCKRPLMKVLNTRYIEKPEAEALLLTIIKIADEYAKHNEEFPDEREGMIFKLVQSVRDKLDEFALSKRRTFPTGTLKQRPLPLTEAHKWAEYRLEEFAEQIKAEVERQQVK